MKDTFQKTEDLVRGVADDVVEDEEVEVSMPGDLVIESGEYQCSNCDDSEFFGAGEEFTECGCSEKSGWTLLESEADSE